MVDLHWYHLYPNPHSNRKVSNLSSKGDEEGEPVTVVAIPTGEVTGTAAAREEVVVTGQIKRRTSQRVISQNQIDPLTRSLFQYNQGARQSLQV